MIIKIKVCFSWFSLYVIAAMLDNVTTGFSLAPFIYVMQRGRRHVVVF